MPGLLDFLSSPDAQFGLGLLGAAAPRAGGVNFGQGLQEALGYVESLKAKQQAAALQKMQIDNYQSEIKQRDAAAFMAQQKQANLASMTDRLLGGARPAQGATNLVNDALPQEFRIGAQPAITGSGGLYGQPVEAVAALHAAGGPDLMKAWEAANVGSSIAAGSYRVLPGQEPKYFTKPESGVDFKNGVLSKLGGSSVLAELEAQKTDLQKQAENRNALLPLGYKTDGGQPIGGTVADYLGQQQKPQVGAPTGLRNQDGSPLSPELQAAIMQDAQANGVSNPTVNMKGGSAYGWKPDTPSIMQNSGRPRLQSDQEVDAQAVEKSRNTEFATQSAKTAVEKIYASHDAAKSASDALTGLNEARKSIAGGVYAGAGAETKLNIAKGLQAFGITIDPEKVTNTDYLQSTLGKGILDKAKTLGANPTDNDARLIKQIVGSIGTDPNALNKLIDAQEALYKNAINRHNTIYQSATKNGFSAPYDMAVELPKFEAEKPAATGAGKFSITAPNGKTYNFSSAEELANFKLATGAR